MLSLRAENLRHPTRANCNIRSGPALWPNAAISEQLLPETRVPIPMKAGRPAPFRLRVRAQLDHHAPRPRTPHGTKISFTAR
jgi:hypothetical protein